MNNTTIPTIHAIKNILGKHPEAIITLKTVKVFKIVAQADKYINGLEVYVESPSGNKHLILGTNVADQEFLDAAIKQSLMYLEAKYKIIDTPKDINWRDVDDMENYKHINSQILIQTDFTTRISSISSVNLYNYRDNGHNEQVIKWAFLNIE